MSLATIGLLFTTILIFGYRFYGALITRAFSFDDQKKTPAHEKNDGIDYVPTRPFYLFAQHFSAIAAAGPIAGPIMACLAWGYVPCLIWLALGVVLIGAVHDFLSLFASVRHGGVSIAEMTKEKFGKASGIALMSFIWLALIYIIVAFTDITASSFVGITEELSNQAISFNPGGAVALAAILYLLLSIVMGLVERTFKPPLWVQTVVFVPLAFSMVWLGTKFSTLLIFDAKTWCALILAYCFVASVLPVWLLLQPRGYLGGFFLYSVIFVGILGVFFGNYEIKQDAFKTWDTGNLSGALFPFLFVTIACGACSGFHGLICSGTTSKQIDRESHTRPIGYGAMLCEAFVALIALATVMIWSPSEIQGLKPGAIYGKGIGEFLTLIVGKQYLSFAVTFGAMVFSTFVFDTLDVSTRLGRYLLQELMGSKGKFSAFCATFLTILGPLFFVLYAKEGSYLQFWTLFGASNQLVAALTLLFLTVWLYEAKKRIAYTLIPMLFVLSVTFWALCDLAISNLQAAEGFSILFINGVVAIILICLAIFLVLRALYMVGFFRWLQNMAIRKAEDT